MEFTTGLKKFKQAFSETDLNELGKRIKFSQKLRKITPFRLALSLISSFAGKIETIADAHRTYNELNEERVQYKPYHKQLAKRAFPNFMRRVVCRLMSEFANRTLTMSDRNPFSMFKHIFIHDGSSYAIKSNLKDIFPGKYKQGPAAVQLHTTMDLLEDEVTAVTIAPFSYADVNYLPKAKEIKNSLLLIDRAYLDFSYLHEVDTHQGFFIVRGKRHMNPVVEQAYDNEKCIKKLIGKKLKQIKIPKNRVIDLDVAWRILGGRINYRLVISWNTTTKAYLYLVTNLPRDKFTVDKILLAYRLRWQIELLFKEWKSYANLQKFDTANPYIAEGLIWAALGVAIVKRFMAHLAQHITQVAISTRIVAMCVSRKIFLIMERLIQHDHHGVKLFFKEAIHYLGDNAKRTNLQREKEKGRCRLGFFAVEGALKD